MGSSPINKMASKLLVIAFALLAVANAADIYSSSYAGLTCAGTATSTSKITLDSCYNNGDGGYEKATLSGSTYTYTTYGTDTTCTTSTGTISAAIDTCAATWTALPTHAVAPGTALPGHAWPRQPRTQRLK